MYNKNFFLHDVFFDRRCKLRHSRKKSMRKSRSLNNFKFSYYHDFRMLKMFTISKFFLFRSKIDRWRMKNNSEKINWRKCVNKWIIWWIICFVNYLFWRQYQFLCKHLWHYNIVFDLFQQFNWKMWTKMFKNNEFEIYETSIKLKIERHEKIEKMNHHMLQMKKVLNVIKKNITK